MASRRLLLLVILSMVNTSLQDANGNEVDDEDTNPFAEAASAILKEQNAQNIGAMINNFVQSGGAEKIGEMVSKFGGKNAGQLLQGLSSLVGSNEKEKETEDDSSSGANTDNLLEGLGSLMGAYQGAAGRGGGGGDGAAALLQGLGSLLTAQGGQGGARADADAGDGTAALFQSLATLLAGQGGREGGGGIDPSVIGTVLNLFAQSQAQSSQPGQPKKKIRVQVGSKTTGANYDISDLLSLAGSFLGGQGQGRGGNLLNYLPMILQTIGSFTGPEADKRAENHADHSSMMPPILEKLHLAFDNFIHSEMGKYFISAIGAEKAFKVFEDENGRFNYSKFTELMENLSFRRHWIRMVTDRIVDILKFASDPKMQKTYLTNAQYLLNGFLKTQGFSKAAFFDITRPTETLSALVDQVIKKYFEVKIASKEYVKPMVEYIQDVNRLAQKSGSFGSADVSKELSNKLADTINLEIIEPIARVNRAYRFAKSTPSCDRYVLCIVNEKNPNEVESLPGLKKLLYKGSSLAAAWFLSEKTGTSFWTLYSDVLENRSCKALYSDACQDFHAEEIKVTTEYVHNEL